MAAHSVAGVKTATLGASVVDTVTLTDKCAAVEVVHHGNVTNPLYVIVDDAIAAPTVAGDNFEVVLPGERLRLSRTGTGSAVIASIISAGAATFTVVGVK
jgi:hypothetical protein